MKIDNIFREAEWLAGINRFQTLSMKYREYIRGGSTLLDFLSEGNLFFLSPSSALRELLILLEIERNNQVTQRALAKRVGLTVATVNEYIKELERKSLIEVIGSARRRNKYLLTPKGKARRSNLLSTYLIETQRLYLAAKEEFRARLIGFYDLGVRRIVLYGVSPTAKIITDLAEEIGFEVIGIVDSDPEKHGVSFLGRIISSPSEIPRMNPEGIVITSLTHKDEIYNKIRYLELIGIEVKVL
jgi:DNA-binding MarR family transcriptional regulator